LRLLIIKISSLGDILNSTYVINAIKKQFPDINIDMVIDPKYQEFVENLNIVNNFFHFDESRFAKLIDFKKNKIKAFLNIFLVLKLIFTEIKKINKNKYDYLIDLQGIEKSLIFYLAVKSKKKACKWSLPYKNVKENKSMHAVLALFMTARKLLPDLKIEFTRYEALNMNLKISGINGITEYPDILIGPFTRWETKNYSVVYYIILSVLLVEKSYKISFIGSRQDLLNWKQQISDFQNYLNIKDENKKGFYQYQHNVLETFSNKDYFQLFEKYVESNMIKLDFGNYSFSELTYLYTKVRLFIGSDSFLSHLAQAINLAQIYIFGPTSVMRFGPITKNISVVFRNNSLNCLECHKRRCPKNGEQHIICMNSIDLKEIFDYSLKILSIVDKGKNK